MRQWSPGWGVAPEADGSLASQPRPWMRFCHSQTATNVDSPRMFATRGRIVSEVPVANMIDHGFAFNAHRWEFTDVPEQGIYTRREVYEGVRGPEDFEPWLSRIETLPPSVLDDAQKRIPAAWYDDDWARLENLLERLYRRRKSVPDLVRRAKKAAVDPFPNWTRVRSAAGGT